MLVAGFQMSMNNRSLTGAGVIVSPTAVNCVQAKAQRNSSALVESRDNIDISLAGEYMSNRRLQLGAEVAKFAAISGGSTLNAD
jgi:hypothetical protein